MSNSDSNIFVLDASAFYSGIPFLSSDCYYTTTRVFEEIKHIRSSFSAVDALLDSGNLKLIDPSVRSITAIKVQAKKSGDYAKLSLADVSIIALALELNGTLISDDYSIANVSKLLGVSVKAIGNRGIRRVRKWINFCSACGKAYGPDVKECHNCGNALRRRYKQL